MTVVSADHYQHYIPIFLRCLRRWGDGVDTRIYLRGSIDGMTEEALAALEEFGALKGHDQVISKFQGKPHGVSATNTLRFLVGDEALSSYSQVMIVDVDLLLYTNLFPYHIQAAENSCFAGHRGPTKRPHRPEICPSWTGDFERVSGGFFMATPEWYNKTVEARRNYTEELACGFCGHYRESDEVTLGRIIKESGLEMPTSKYFPTELRGVHLGDFKDSMAHRWTSMAKMVGKLTDDNCMAYISMTRDPAWAAVVEILKADPVITKIFENVMTHIQARGLI